MNIELIERHRNYLDDLEWWDSVHEDFTVEMDAKGVRVHNIYFSGFWSQGDGACFEGRISDWGKALAAMGYNNPNPLFVEYVSTHVQAVWYHRGSYYHENSIHFDMDIPTPQPEDCPYSDDDFITAAWLAMVKQYDLDRLEINVEKFIRGECEELYSWLGKEYDYLTSDEAVWEFIVANDLCKQERGVA